MPDFRIIPSIDDLRQRSTVRALEARFGADATVDALRHAAAAVRTALAGGDTSLASEAAVTTRIEAETASELGQTFRPSLEAVINATGVIVHTNLGRAPLADAAVERIGAIARGYSSLEYDVARGARGRRDVHAEALLCRVTTAPAAVVVNNNAAATMIILAALAQGREVIVSRGELVEIGGGFRVPDVMAQSGAILREVGTTNKTRASDYAAAITERTALILRVHPSNFRIEGFTARPALGDLVAIGKKFNVPVAEDLGSGYMAPSSPSLLRPLPFLLRPPPSLSRSSSSVPRRRAGSRRQRGSGRGRLLLPAATSCSADRRPGSSSADPICWRRFDAPADARAARGQADLRGARGDIGRDTSPAARRQRCRSSAC